MNTNKRHLDNKSYITFLILFHQQTIVLNREELKKKSISETRNKNTHKANLMKNNLIVHQTVILENFSQH